MLHDHTPDIKINKGIIFSLVLTLIFATLELVVGTVSGSLALIADSGHMFSDSLSLTILITSSIIAKYSSNRKNYSFGLGKLDVIAAVFNIILVFIVCYHIFGAAIARSNQEYSLDPNSIIITAIIGLAVNILVMKLLGELDSIGAESAKLHVVGDILGSIAAIISGVSILITNNSTIDIILSVFICVFLSITALKQFKKCLNITLDATPDNINVDDVKESILKCRTIIDVHDIHIWISGSNEVSLTAHVDVDTFELWDDTLREINSVLLNNFKINHTTIQPEMTYAKSGNKQIFHYE